MKTNRVKAYHKVSPFKVVMTIIFAILIFGVFFYRIFGTLPEDSFLKPEYLSYACVCLCFLLSLLFVRIDSKKILMTLILAVCVVADYFLILNPSEEGRFIGLCIFCLAQLLLAIYTLLLNKGIGSRVANLAIRVALCLVAYYVLPLYFTLGTTEFIAVMYIINFLVSLAVLLWHIKTEWLTFVGFLLFFLCDIVVGLTNGGFEILQMTGSFVDFLTTHDVSFWLYIPGLFGIATSAVFSKIKTEV